MTEQTIKRNLYSGAALCVLCIVLSIVSFALGMNLIALIFIAFCIMQGLLLFTWWKRKKRLYEKNTTQSRFSKRA